MADPNTIVIANDFATLEGALAFTQDPSLPDAMQRGGVDGAPQVWIVDEAEARHYGDRRSGGCGALGSAAEPQDPRRSARRIATVSGRP